MIQKHGDNDHPQATHQHGAITGMGTGDPEWALRLSVWKELRVRPFYAEDKEE
jgi:hypothetical protein